MTMTRTLIATTAALGLAAATAPVQADLITEYMNNYGETDVDVIGLNGGTGWGSAWVRESSGANTAKYDAGAQLMYSASGYENTGNESDSNDGNFDRSNNAPEYGRTFAAPTTAPTVWTSGLVRFGRGDGTDSPRISLDGDAGTTTFGFNDSGAGSGNDNVAQLVLTGATTQTTSTTFALNTVHLLLARVELNFSGTSDRVTFWVNPDVSGVDDGSGPEGADALPAFTLQATGDLGNTLTTGGFLFGRNTAELDALRISDTLGNGGDNALNEVLSGEEFVAPPIPEPASLALLGLGGLLLLPRRKR